MAGMIPDSFWSCTFDEAILFYKGYIDKARFQRSCTKLIHESLVGSKDAVDIMQFLPLPFDDELSGGKANEMDIFAEYELLKKSGALD